MKLLCLTQPWASLMAIGAKRWETRGWGTSYRGPIAIASTKNFPSDCKELSRMQPFMTVLDAAGLYSPAHLNDTLGHVLCVVDLQWIARVNEHVGLLGQHLVNPAWTAPEAWVEFMRDSHEAQSCPASEHEFSFGNYAHGRCVWMTNNLRRLAEPVPVVGHQGLRDLDPAVEAEIRKQLP